MVVTINEKIIHIDDVDPRFHHDKEITIIIEALIDKDAFLDIYLHYFE